MLKSIKIPENAYKVAKALSKKLKERGEYKGVYEVPISTAISYALETTLENIERKEAFARAAGSWKDVDAKALIKDIYEGRKKGTNWDIKLD